MTADTDKKIEVMQSEIGTKIDDLHTDIVEMRRDYDMRLDTISDSVGGTAIRISAIEMDHIKQIIVDRRMPLEERISAGDKYITAGGNSDIALMVEVLKEKRKDGLHRYESGDITEAEG
ncbi:MAG: hypothetical protein LBJ91_02715 [Clostridiales Family XIII bacterium]|nr:hypothetical protein [Clostridiales Family XIII bacterium]